MSNKERKKEISKQPIPTIEECLGFYKELTNLADVRFVPYYKMAIKALDQEPRKDEVILTKKEYGELVSSEFDNGYTKGYTEALEQNDVLDKIRAEIEEKYGNYDICEWFEDYDYEETDISEYRSVGNVSDILAIIDKYKAEGSGKE